MFSQALAHRNSKNEIKETDTDKRGVSVERSIAGRKKKKSRHGQSTKKKILK